MSDKSSRNEMLVLCYIRVVVWFRLEERNLQQEFPSVDPSVADVFTCLLCRWSRSPVWREPCAAQCPACSSTGTRWGRSPGAAGLMTSCSWATWSAACGPSSTPSAGLRSWTLWWRPAMRMWVSHFGCYCVERFWCFKWTNETNHILSECTWRVIWVNGRPHDNWQRHSWLLFSAGCNKNWRVRGFHFIAAGGLTSLTALKLHEKIQLRYFSLMGFKLGSVEALRLANYELLHWNCIKTDQWFLTEYHEIQVSDRGRDLSFHEWLIQSGIKSTFRWWLL